jgi:BirA family biotin operon repressor/biotin-[acetyl-CoA-carboxylase] ligase
MIEFSAPQQNILKFLSADKATSLDALASMLQMPAQKICPLIEELQTLTDLIKQPSKNHFQLNTPYFSIEKQHLLAPLQALGFKTIDCFDCIDSTNQFLKQNKKLPMPALCHSNLQTKGRGRQGRSWYSSFGSNLCFSIKYPIPTSIAKCSGLSLMIGLSLVEAIEQHLGEKRIRLKWPNDLLWEQKKLAGILIEISDNDLIIGVGINVNCLSHDTPLITKPWTSLREIYQKPITREALLLACLEKIHHNSIIFFQKGFSVFHEQWQQKDAFINQTIAITRVNQRIEGQCKGISSSGNLLILNHQGELLEIESGELS